MRMTTAKWHLETKICEVRRDMLTLISYPDPTAQPVGHERSGYETIVTPHWTSNHEVLHLGISSYLFCDFFGSVRRK